VVECSPDADRQAQISQAMDLANLIAIHFGLKAAFTFAGALGYVWLRIPLRQGRLHPGDRGQVKVKYLSK
jgi:hypothetical protein